ncbi:hypothetical protein ElyMa_000465100 [Elysia marginata]|uniref:Uncharacterized protein n=1 Tax=Elysia marginata TaxID=1093978 RepID=A0AAV4FSZ6_9GAST|nr:hypothetical protein ElyMa_000465100 [Elysia marginata]
MVSDSYCKAVVVVVVIIKIIAAVGGGGGGVKVVVVSVVVVLVVGAVVVVVLVVIIIVVLVVVVVGGGEGELTRDWTGTLQEDFSLHTSHVINFTSALYHPWGNRGGSAAAAILYTAWISGINLFLIFLLITNVKLLNCR